MKQRNYTYRWLKAQKKYRNLQRRLQTTSDENLVVRIQAKLVHLKNRLLAMNKKWKLGIAASLLMAWMAASPAHAQFSSPFELSSINGTNGFRINGNSIYDATGYSVAGGGDINGDGISDVLIGSYNANYGPGGVYVVFGTSTGFSSSFELSNLDGANGFAIAGTGLDGNLSQNVDILGDMNGDGIDDIIFGTYDADPNGNYDAGKAFIVFGKNTAVNGNFPATMDLSTLDGANGFAINGLNADDQLGTSVSSASDINNDGFADAIIGARLVDIGGNYDAGASYVIFGKNTAVSGNFASNFELTTLDGSNGFVLNGDNAEDETGFSVADAGDINGDAIDDIIIGSPEFFTGRPGEAYVVFGSSSGFSSSIDLSSLNGNDGFVINGITGDDRAGWSVAGAGDINDDGIDDVMLSATYTNSNNGESYIVFGKSSGFTAAMDLSTLNGANGFVVPGTTNSYSGSSLSSAGDINGDGIDDFVIGARNATNTSNDGAGQSYLIFGKNTASDGDFPGVLSPSSLDGNNGFIIGGEATYDYSGFSVSAAGDVNGDGVDDILVGAPIASPGGIGIAGTTYVVFGSAISNGDNAPPLILSQTPPDDVVNSEVGMDLVVDFNEDVQKGTGNITIKKLSDDTTVEAIDVTSGQVTIAGAQVTINPAADLPDSEDLYVLIDATAVGDLAGNAFAGISDNTSWNIATKDLTAPVVVVQDITVSLDASGQLTITPDQIDNGSTDNVTAQENLVLSLDITQLDCSNVGTNPVNLTVTDQGGNSNSVSATVTVSDITPPVAVAQDITVQLDATGSVTILASDIDNGSSDACGIASLSLDQDTFGCGDVSSPPTVTLTATDVNGLFSTVMATVTVEAATWYADTDGDGYGDPASSQVSCTQPVGSVLDNTDCNDTNAVVNPGVIWYADSDGDGYGNPANTQAACVKPAGFVADNSDCNDTDATINPQTNWYADTDGDGFGDASSSQTSCTQPTGFVTDNTDCDDTDALINPAVVWYADTDTDGFGDLAVTQTSCAQPSGYVSNSTDCDDTNINITPENIWYADTDGDGHGDAATTQTACIQPAGFVANSDDCNDTDADVYPGAPTLADGKDNNCDGTVDKLAQTITLGAIADQLDDGGTVNITADSNSGLALEYSIAGSATISGSVLTTTGAGTVTLTATQPGSDGYDAATPVSITFCVNPVPVVNVTGEGEVALELASSYATGNQWFESGNLITGETNQTYAVPAGGVYKVIVTIDGCIGESSEIEAVLTGLGAKIQSDLRIYPVPVGDRLTIETKALEKGEYQFRIIDVSGKEWKKQVLKVDGLKSPVQINVSYVPAGSYSILLQKGNDLFVKKIIKK